MAISDLATLMVVSQNSAQFMLTQFPFPSFQEMAFSLAYFSAFEIRYSGVVFADMTLDTTSADLTVYQCISIWFSNPYGKTARTFSRQSAPPLRLASGEAGEGRLGTRFGELAHPYYPISPQNIHYFGEMLITAL